MRAYAVSIVFLLSMSCLDKNGVLKLPEEELSNAEQLKTCRLFFGCIVAFEAQGRKDIAACKERQAVSGTASECQNEDMALLNAIGNCVVLADPISVGERVQRCW